MGLFEKLFRNGAKNAAPTQTVGEVIEYYRQFGFFAGQTSESILAEAREEWGEEPPLGKPLDEVFLLRYDKTKIWADDPEADVCAENEVYHRVLEQWAKITDGAFLPNEIQERWESETGPITITFELAGKPFAIKPSYQDDWIDLEILLQLNQILSSSGKRFNCAVDGNFCLLMFVDGATEKRLRTERKFPFALP